MSEYFSMREPIDVDSAVERTMVNIGEILRRQRLAKGLKLDDIARELRIDVRQLEALENNQYAIFSGSVFIRGY
ncbi:MAG: hypothetical protein FD130_1212, partial [Halothiobacillaceae bacterium]